MSDIDWDNCMVDRNDPNVGNFDGRKIIFIKKTEDMSEYYQCSNCLLMDHPDCDEFYGGSVKCDDSTKVWQYAPEVSEEPSAKPPEPAAGRKFDSGKPRYSLIPPNALEEVARVLTYGSQKYEDHNWLRVDNANDRFFSAANRHMWAWKKGEKIDDENQCSHLAAAIASLMFILELEFIDGKNKTAT